MSCAVYYWLWIFILPKIGGYRIRQELLVLENGAQSHRVVKVSLAELAQWDASHDAIGRSTYKCARSTQVMAWKRR